MRHLVLLAALAACKGSIEPSTATTTNQRSGGEAPSDPASPAPTPGAAPSPAPGAGPSPSPSSAPGPGPAPSPSPAGEEVAPATLDFTFGAVLADGRLNASELASGVALGTPTFPFQSAGYAVVPAATTCMTVETTSFIATTTLTPPASPTEGVYKICARFVDMQNRTMRGESATFEVDTVPPNVIAEATWTASGLHLSGTAAGAVSWSWAQTSGPVMASVQTPAAAGSDVGGLAAGTFRFTATATDAAGNQGNVAIDVVVTAPVAPSALKATADDASGAVATIDDDTGVFFVWTPGTDASGVASHRVEIFTNANCTGTASVTENGVTTASLPFTGVTATTYTFRVTVVARSGLTATSSCSGAIAIDATPPPAATALATAADADNGADTRTDDDTTIYFHWSQGADTGSGVRDFTVRVYNSATCTGTPADIAGLTLPKHTYTADDFTTYSYRVVTYDNAGHPSAPSACSGSMTVDSLDNASALVLGGAANLRAWQTNQFPARSAHDGGFEHPRGLAIGGTHLFVADRDNNRLSRFTTTSGVPTGWTGMPAFPPTGGGGSCIGVTDPPNLFCTGGAGTWTNYPEGFPHIYGVAADATHVYAADEWSHVIQKRTHAGVRVGWIGGINERPASGAAGCSTANPGDVTPGWCEGGFWQEGSAFGKYSGPRGVAVDGTYLYVADAQNHRVVRVNKATGAVVSWLGVINGVPSGGHADCTTTAVGFPTPGWCVGGTSSYDTVDRAFYSPTAVAVNATGTTLYVAESEHHRVQKFTIDGTHDVTYGGWIGARDDVPTGGGAGCTGLAFEQPTPHWCFGGDAHESSEVGGFFGIRALAVDDTDFLYVADAANHRIVKYSSGGVVIGWMGRILTSPTGGVSGCNGAAVGSVTPGWCTGGTAQAGKTDGAFESPHGVTTDATYLYVSDSVNNRVQRFNRVSGSYAGSIGAGMTAYSGWQTNAYATAGGAYDGAFASPQFIAEDGNGNAYVTDRAASRVVRKNKASGVVTGWIGVVKTTPTGGDAGCTATTTGQKTPGWCLGGDAMASEGDGGFAGPTGIAILGDDMYVADFDNFRLTKFTVSTGAFVGWVGKIGTPPTGGQSTCAGAATGTTTPGWCTGGTAAYYDRGLPDHSGGLVGAVGVAVNGTHVFVTDGRETSRILRFATTTGAYGGWIGRIRTVPASGGASCTGAATGTGTPTWCFGGEPESGDGDNAFDFPRGLALDSTYLYVADTSNARIARVNLATGAYGGWVGYIDASPTGGQSTCNGAATGTYTPGWCLGGDGRGWNNEAISDPSGIAIRGSHLYVTLGGLGKVYKLEVGNGAIVGWRGKVRNTCGAYPPDSIISTEWCVGGASVMGLDLGAFYYAQGIMVDAANKIYVVETDNQRVTRLLGP